MPKKVMTVVFVRDGKGRGRKVLLGLKMTKIGAGRYNGPGGKVEKWELSYRSRAKLEKSRRSRATLEMFQESGLVCFDEDLQKVAICHFINIEEDGSMYECEVHVYFAELDKCHGRLRPTDEVSRWEWFLENELPEMMVADPYWFPKVLMGKKLIVRATMKNHQSELVGEVEIVEVDSFD
jgi:hypothetical protein